VFGTKRVGWLLFVIFSLLAVLQLMRAWQPVMLGLDPRLTLDLLNFLVPVLLLCCMVHIETLLREHRRVEEQEKKLREELEVQVRERTAALDQAYEGLQRELSLRKQGQEELRKSKEQYRFLFDENPQPMWIYDRSTFEFLTFNAATLRHYGYGAAEFRELTAKDLCPPGEVENFVADSARSSPIAQRRGLWRHCKRDGSIVEVEITALDLIYSGRPARLVLANDVTAQRQLQKQLVHTQKMQATQQVAGGVADRFSRLIATIEADTSFLAQETRDPDSCEGLRRIAASAACASGLTRQLLALVGRHPMQSRMLNLNELVETEIGASAGKLGDRIVLEKVYWDNLPPVAGDPALMRQVVRHLVTNACDAMPNGGTLRLNTAAVSVDEGYARRHEGARPGSFVCLGVSDTGCGMSPEVQARLFEPFFTTKDAAKAAGLGLATVHGVVTQHDGWIEVDSEPGTGTKIRVFLPCGTRVAAFGRKASSLAA
jgi:PAS domain S-box-containing protein